MEDIQIKKLVKNRFKRIQKLIGDVIAFLDTLVKDEQEKHKCRYYLKLFLKLL